MPTSAKIGATTAHPLIDEAGTGWVATHTTDRVYAFTPLLADLLRLGVQQRIRVIVIAAPTTRLTLATKTALETARALWLVHSNGTLYSARTGRIVTNLDDATRGSVSEDVAPEFLAAGAVMVPSLEFRAFGSHAATASLRPGRTLAALTSATPHTWGVTEPLSAPWSTTALSAHARERMPNAPRYAVTDAAGTLSALVTARRTRSGVSEVTEALVRTADLRAARQGLIAAAATDIAGATASLWLGASDLTYRSHIAPPPNLVGLFVGARTLIASGHDVSWWRDEVDATMISSPSGRCVLVTFDPRTGGTERERLWHVLGPAARTAMGWNDAPQ